MLYSKALEPVKTEKSGGAIDFLEKEHIMEDVGG